MLAVILKIKPVNLGSSGITSRSSACTGRGAGAISTKQLSSSCTPKLFKAEQKLDLYQPSKQVVTEKVEIDIHSDELDRQIGDTLADKLRGDLELIEGVYPEY